MKKTIILTAIFMTAFSGLTWADKVVTKYYSDGTLLSKQVYYDNGAHKGPDKFYYPNGRKRIEYIYKGGKIYKTLRWTDDGQRIN